MCMSDRITIRMEASLIARLDAWIATQPGHVSRQEVIRRSLSFALDHPALALQYVDRHTELSDPATETSAPMKGW